MFEGSLITLLAADTDLTDRLAVYKSSPAIFVNRAPSDISSDAGLAYIVFDIDVRDNESLAIDWFDIEFEIFDKISRSKIVREIVERISFVLDTMVIEDDTRYGDIRFYRQSSGFLMDNNSKVTHYEVRFAASGTRKKWINQL